MFSILRFKWNFNFLASLMLVVYSQVAYAQDIDSLLTVMNKNTKEDTARVNLLAQIASRYRNTNTDSMLAVAERGILLANKISFQKGKARCLASLGVGYMFKDNLQMADSICNAAIALFEQTKDSVGMTQVFYYLGNIRFRQAKYQNAIAYFIKTAELGEKANDYKMVARALDNVGVNYVVMGNNTEALKYYLKALKIWEKIGDNAGKGSSLSDIARVYVALGDKAKAIEYINQSIATQKGYADVQTMIHCYLNAVSIYTETNNDSAAIAVCTEAIRLAEATGQQSELTVMLIDRGMAYYSAHKYEEAFADYMKCLKLTKDRPSPAMAAEAHMGLGEIWMARGNAAKSIPHLEIAYALFRENEMEDQTGPAADLLGAAYEKSGDFQKALKFTKIGHTIKDSIYNESNTKQQQQLQFDYELEKKQNRIGILEKKSLIAQNKSDRQRATLWALIGGIAFVVIVAIQLYRAKAKEKRSKDTIAEQASNLNELNKFKDKVFSVLSHDLRGPINSIATTLNMLDEDLLSPKEFASLKPEMKKQLEAITFLLDNLLKWSKNYIMGVTAATTERINIYEISQQSIDLLAMSAKEKNITVYNNIPESFTASGDPGQIDIVIRNLVSNALKFTDINGTITISAITEGSTAKIHISDNGVGMTTEQIKKLFLTTHTSTYGTKGETGTGLGLLLCYEFIKANNGAIEVISEVFRVC